MTARSLLRVLPWLFLLVTAGARAHEMSIAELEVRQLARTDFVWQWAASGSRPAAQELKLRWPPGCRAEGVGLRCGEAGLAGSLAVEGVGRRYSAALVRIHWLDGQTRVHTLTSAQPAVRLFGSPEDRRGAAEVVVTYIHLGIEHILSGFDHLMFVLGLLFLVGFRRRLVATVTAFTAAHSLTLAASALGWLVLRPPPVEATIALSIVLVAGEALHDRPTWSRRWPALVAGLFGLVHGLGFAGALREVGLPKGQSMGALLGFNIGVELGQLAVIVLAGIVALGIARLGMAARLRTPALYAIGSVAGWWTWSRAAALLA